ncbi:MAG: hypothetical protein JNL57_09645 [Bacteroidetes bacterium]|nr:hypothetical protein [Bacteroidota bacterium]
MKTTQILVCFALALATAAACKEEDPTTYALTFDDVKGNYIGSAAMDYPNIVAGGYTSVTGTDTLRIEKISDKITLSSRLLGSITGTEGARTENSFELKFTEQLNGKRGTAGENYKSASGGGNLIIRLTAGKFELKNDTLETDSCMDCTRYRAVSLEK